MIAFLPAVITTVVLGLISTVSGLGTACSTPLGAGNAAAGAPFWMQSIAHQGTSAYNAAPSTYEIFRNVKVSIPTMVHGDRPYLCSRLSEQSEMVLQMILLQSSMCFSRSFFALLNMGGTAMPFPQAAVAEMAVVQPRKPLCFPYFTYQLIPESSITPAVVYFPPG